MFGRLKKWISSLRKWISYKEIKSLEEERDSLDYAIKQLEKECDNYILKYKSVLIEKMDVINSKKSVEEDLAKVETELFHWKKIYFTLKNEHKKAIEFLDKVNNSIESELIGAAATMDAIVEPKTGV